MSAAPRKRVPITPTLVVVIGLLVGVIGLLMLLLGIGVLSPTILDVPGISLKLETATPGIVVMVIGFATALLPIVTAMQVDMRTESRAIKNFVRLGAGMKQTLIASRVAMEDAVIALQDEDVSSDRRTEVITSCRMSIIGLGHLVHTLELELDRTTRAQYLPTVLHLIAPLKQVMAEQLKMDVPNSRDNTKP